MDLSVIIQSLTKELLPILLEIAEKYPDYKNQQLQIKLALKNNIKKLESADNAIKLAYREKAEKQLFNLIKDNNVSKESIRNILSKMLIDHTIDADIKKMEIKAKVEMHKEEEETKRSIWSITVKNIVTGVTVISLGLTVTWGAVQIFGSKETDDQ